MSVVIRTAQLSDAEAMGRINVDSWRATYAGLIDQAVLDAMTYEAYAGKWKRHLERLDPNRFMFVAETDGAVIGYSTGGANRDAALGFDAELYALYLRSEFHGTGIGKALFISGLRFLLERGFHSISLYVLAANTIGRRFYDRYDPDVQLKATTSIEGNEYCDMCYGWHSIESMLGK